MRGRSTIGPFWRDRSKTTERELLRVKSALFDLLAVEDAIRDHHGECDSDPCDACEALEVEANTAYAKAREVIA